MLVDKEMKEKENMENYSVEHNQAINTEPKRPFVRTFGFFDVFIDGRPLQFSSLKEKELMAVLIDHEGGFASDGEILDCLYEGQPQDNVLRTQYRRIIKRLTDTLSYYDISHIMIRKNRSMCILKDQVDCDMFFYKSGVEKYIEQYDGFYMRNYSWAETTHAALEYRQASLNKNKT